MIHDVEIGKRMMVARFTKKLRLKRDYRASSVFVGAWSKTRGYVSIQLGPKDFSSKKDHFSIEIDLATLKELVALVENEAKKDETSEALNPKTLKFLSLSKTTQRGI